MLRADRRIEKEMELCRQADVDLALGTAAIYAGARNLASMLNAAETHTGSHVASENRSLIPWTPVTMLAGARIVELPDAPMVSATKRPR